jgi:hypothetical protein
MADVLKKKISTVFSKNLFLALLSINCLAASEYAIASDSTYTQLHGQDAVIQGCPPATYYLSADTQLNYGSGPQNCNGQNSLATFNITDAYGNVTNNTVKITCPGTYTLKWTDLGFWCNQYEWENVYLKTYVNGVQVPQTIYMNINGGGGKNCESNGWFISLVSATGVKTPSGADAGGNGPTSVTFKVTPSQMPATVSFSVFNNSTNSGGSCGNGGGGSSNYGMGWHIGGTAHENDGAAFTITRTSASYN